MSSDENLSLIQAQLDREADLIDLIRRSESSFNHDYEILETISRGNLNKSLIAKARNKETNNTFAIKIQSSFIGSDIMV